MLKAETGHLTGGRKGNEGRDLLGKAEIEIDVTTDGADYAEGEWRLAGGRGGSGGETLRR